MIRTDDEGYPLRPFHCEMLIYAHSAIDAAKMVEDIGVRSSIVVTEV